MLTVTDDGPGISEDLQSVLFERFARGDGSRARATGSDRLGLSIVAAVVEGHHGAVAVESEPGRTVFTVRAIADSRAAPHGFADTPAPTRRRNLCRGLRPPVSARKSRT